jgi:hypothetical protein
MGVWTHVSDVRHKFMSNTTDMCSFPQTHLKSLCLTSLTWVHAPIPTSSVYVLHHWHGFMPPYPPQMFMPNTTDKGSYPPQVFMSNITDMGSYPHTHLKSLCLTSLTWVHAPLTCLCLTRHKHLRWVWTHVSDVRHKHLRWVWGYEPMSVM